MRDAECESILECIPVADGDYMYAYRKPSNAFVCRYLDGGVDKLEIYVDHGLITVPIDGTGVQYEGGPFHGG